MNAKHDHMVDRINRNRAPRKPLEVGAKVWVYKHKIVGGYKIDARWWGPAVVVARTSNSSYTVQFDGDARKYT